MAYSKSEIVPPKGTRLVEIGKPDPWIVEAVLFGAPTKLRLKSGEETRSVIFNPPPFWQTWDVGADPVSDEPVKNVFGQLWREIEAKLLDRGQKGVGGISLPAQPLPVAFRLGQLGHLTPESVTNIEDLHGLSLVVADLEDKDLDPDNVELWKANAQQIANELANL